MRDGGGIAAARDCVGGVVFGFTFCSVACNFARFCASCSCLDAS